MLQQPTSSGGHTNWAVGVRKNMGEFLPLERVERERVSHSGSAAGVRGADAETHIVPVRCERMGVLWKTL